jgi:hypothetical protein
MSTTPTTYLRFSINENVLSLRDLVGCLGIAKKDIHAMRLVVIGEDDWNTYEFDLDCLVTAKEIDAEFGGTYVIKNVYVNGIALEDYDYDDTESTQETVASDLLNDTDAESEGESEGESESESESDDESDSESESEDESEDSEQSKESMEKSPEEFLTSLQKKFPDITTEPPSDEQKAILEKIAGFFREEKIALGNYKDGSVKACTGYSPMKDGGILLYF